MASHVEYTNIEEDAQNHMNVEELANFLLDILSKTANLLESGGGQGGREPGRIGAGGGREAGGDAAGCGSHVRAGGGRRMWDIKFSNDFLVPF